VRYAIERGHKVTLFNRGKTNPKLFPEVEKLQGDRATGNLDALKGREWDAVIDNPTTLPMWVRDAGEALKGKTNHYVFISTLSVYADNSKPDMDESAPVTKMDEALPIVAARDPRTKGLMENYGGLKALSEREAERAFAGRTTIIRPGLIVGPGDLSDRFSYWPVRIERGGEVLAPGAPDDRVQIIDARDLGEWTIRMVEQGATGTYNAVGPKAPLTIAEMLYGIRAVTTADVRFTWVDADFLEKEKVRPWADMPVWIPAQGEYAGFGRRSNRRAIERGLTFRSLADTSRATLDWYKTRPAEEQAKLRSGLAPEREQAVLAAWHVRAASQGAKKS
jgi:2'-hydroxyisoflavone reductase